MSGLRFGTLVLSAGALLIVLAHCRAQTVGDRLDGLWATAQEQIAAGQADDALETGRRAVAIAPRRATAWLILAWVHERRGELDLEEQVVREGLTAVGEDASLHSCLAYCLELQGKLDAAIAAYKKAIPLYETPAGSAPAWFNLANAYARRGRAGDLDAAIAAYRKTIGLETDARTKANAWVNLAVVLRRRGGRGDLDESIAACETAVSLYEDPADRATPLNNLGLALRDRGREGDLDRAVEAHRQAIPLYRSDEERAVGWGNLSSALVHQGNLADALEAAQSAVEANAAFAGCRNALAYAHAYLGRWSDALREAEEAVRLSPRDPGALDSFGAIAALSGDLPRAEEALRGGLAMDQPPASSHAVLAYCLAREGKTAEARRAMTAVAKALAAKGADKDRDLMYFAGRAYDALGQTAQATAVFRRVVRASDGSKHPWVEEMRKYIAEHK